MSNRSGEHSTRRYRYYVCQAVLKMGAHACPTGRVAAHEVERLVVEQIRAIGRDPDLIAETVRQARVQRNELVARHQAEEKTLRRELRLRRASLTRLMAKYGATADLQAVQERIAAIEARLSALPGEIAAAKRLDIDEHGLAKALETFEPVWESLWPTERSRILRLLTERIDYDGQGKQIAVRFRTDGIGALTNGTA